MWQVPLSCFPYLTWNPTEMGFWRNIFGPAIDRSMPYNKRIWMSPAYQQLVTRATSTNSSRIGHPKSPSPRGQCHHHWERQGLHLAAEGHEGHGAEGIQTWTGRKTFGRHLIYTYIYIYRSVTLSLAKTMVFWIWATFGRLSDSGCLWHPQISEGFCAEAASPSMTTPWGTAQTRRGWAKMWLPWVQLWLEHLELQTQPEISGRKTGKSVCNKLYNIIWQFANWRIATFNTQIMLNYL